MTYTGHRDPQILIPLLIFCWVYEKSKMYAGNSRTIQELLASIRAEIIAISFEMLKKVDGANKNDI